MAPHCVKRYGWSAREEHILRTLYPDSPTADLAKILARAVDRVYAKANALGLLKSPAYLASPAACRLRRGDQVGASFRFKPGQTPANKGLRRPGWAPGRMAQTQFKKGAKPHTWLPIGSERFSKEGYLQRKVTDTGYTPRDFRPAHHLVWEAVNGQVPKGFALVFKNADRTDIRLDNLELISRADLMRRNSFRTHYPKEVQDLIQLRGAVVRQINRRIRNEKQDPGSP